MLSIISDTASLIVPIYTILAIIAIAIFIQNEKIEKLQDAIAKKYGFRLESHKHELYGTCSQCKIKLNS